MSAFQVGILRIMAKVTVVVYDQFKQANETYTVKAKVFQDARYYFITIKTNDK